MYEQQCRTSQTCPLPLLQGLHSHSANAEYLEDEATLFLNLPPTKSAAGGTGAPDCLFQKRILGRQNGLKCPHSTCEDDLALPTSALKQVPEPSEVRSCPHGAQSSSQRPTHGRTVNLICKDRMPTSQIRTWSGKKRIFFCLFL